jgi:uncharacterized protein YdaU (DUF1376 family)
MAGRKAPKHDTWMPFYVADYLADTMHLTTEQHGAYLLLIMAAWKADGKLPNDADALRQITRMTAKQWDRAEPILERFFIVTEGFWIHSRVRQELERAKSNVAKKAGAGVVGAANRWGLCPDDVSDHAASRSERLTNARRLATHTREEWTALVEVCGRVCVRCRLPEAPLWKDHIKPIYQGGSDGIANLQPVCQQCSSSRGAETKDYRPSDWLERLTERLAKRHAEARQES